MSENVKMSVIVPIYNVQKYIEQCIESIIHQNYSEIEIILVDDGSNDNCFEICNKYANKDNRIKVIHKENGGLVSARKAGALLATGEYIICVDGDDWIESSYVSNYVDIIRKYNPDIVCTGAYAVGEDRREINNPCNNGLYDKEEIIKSIFPILIQPSDGDAFPPSQWAKAFRRDLYLNYQLSVNDHVSNGEDIACVIPCIYNAKTIYIDDKNKYFYRYNPMSISKKKSPLSWDGLEGLYDTLIREINLNEYDFKRQFSQRIVRELFIVSASQFYKKTSYFKICSDIREHLKIDIYKNAISSSEFKIKMDRNSIVRKFYYIVLKTRCCFFMWLYSLK